MTGSPKDNKSLKNWLFGTADGVKERVLFASVFVVVFYLAQSMLALWWNTDEYRFSLVLNGLYSADNYCMFFSPVVAWLVRGVDAVFPLADGRMLIVEVLMLAGLWCVFYLLVKRTKRLTALSVFVLAVFVNFDINILHAPFTLAACLFAGMGILLLAAYVAGAAGTAFAAAGVVLVVFGYLWRAEACLLAIPFFALMLAAVLLRCVREREFRFGFYKRLALCLVPVLLLCGAARLTAKRVNAREEYRAGINYNAYRSDACDFAGKDPAEIADALAERGLSENDYRMAQELIVMDTELIDTSFLQNIYSVSGLSGGEKVNAFLTGSLVKMRSEAAGRPFICLSAALLLYCLAVLLCTKGALWSKLALGCDILGAAVLILWLTFKGHIPLYLTEGILAYALFAAALVFVTEERERTGPATRWKLVIMVLALAAALGTVGFKEFSADFKSDLFDTALNAKAYEDFEKPLAESIDPSPDTVLIWGVYDRNYYLNTILPEHSKLVSHEFLMHTLVDGEWTYGQAYFNDLLAESGIGNPMRALTEREHTYYLADFQRCKIVMTFLREHYDPDITASVVGQLPDSEGIMVWQFSDP